MATNKKDPEAHSILWVFIVHMLRALGPERGREVLASSTDWLSEQDIWPAAQEKLVEELTEAYVTSLDLRDTTATIKACVEKTQQAFMLDHLIQLTQEATSITALAEELKKLHADGHIPGMHIMGPLERMGVPRNIIDAILKKAGIEIDEFGATKGCQCSNCATIRAGGRPPGSTPDLN